MEDKQRKFICSHLVSMASVSLPFHFLLKIYSLLFSSNVKCVQWNYNIISSSDCRWAYPTVAKIFYDTLSHSIVVPLSIMLVPYFDAALPNYMHYASVGVSIAKEILRSITKAFEAKLMRCVPSSVNVFSNSSRMELLLHSGGLQISYHSLMTLAGPIKGMVRLPNMNMMPQQIFFLVSAQEMCVNSIYAGVNTNSDSFTDM